MKHRVNRASIFALALGCAASLCAAGCGSAADDSTQETAAATALATACNQLVQDTRRLDPGSLRFAPGYQPDFRRVLEIAASTSRLYGGRPRRFRILSANRRIQYLFMAGPRQVWIVPPQATTTELSSYGVRTVDVLVDEDLCVPGYEYHQGDGPGESQIPPGYAGAVSPQDPSRSDASPWLERLPVIQEFRRTLQGPRR